MEIKLKYLKTTMIEVDDIDPRYCGYCQHFDEDAVGKPICDLFETHINKSYTELKYENDKVIRCRRCLDMTP
jgi:hypothetical protein